MSGRLIRREFRYERNYTQVPNAWMRDERLSFRARGLLGLLATHKTGFSVTLKSLASTSPSEGLDALRAAVNELEKLGYLRRYTKASRGRFTPDDWEVMDPSELGTPSLIAPPTALDEPTRASATALDEPTRTALDDPTLKNTKKKTTTGGPQHHSPARARAVAILGCYGNRPHRFPAYAGDGDDVECLDCTMRRGVALQGGRA